MEIEIRAGGVVLAATLNDSATARQIAAALPLAADASIWGDEIYFAVDVIAPAAEDAVEDVDIGTLAYWPPGRAFCIFYGPTPASRGAAPRAASPVNVIGHVQDDATALRKLSGRVNVTVTAGSVTGGSR